VLNPEPVTVLLLPFEPVALTGAPAPPLPTVIVYLVPDVKDCDAE
jgi:hypothetical protein